MMTAGIEDREAKAADYLQSLGGLTAELERAMQAIAQNALAEFEESIANQQTMSARLANLADGLRAPLESDSAIFPGQLDEDLMRQIRVANDTLQRLNRRYAALLQHSSRSVTLMTSLFGSFQGQFQEASGPRSKHQTWSCRM